MGNRVKIYIEMDEGWMWEPVTEDHPLREYYSKDMTFEVNEELLTEYEAAHRSWAAVQKKLEQLYRVQEGMSERDSTPGLTPVTDYISIKV